MRLKDILAIITGGSRGIGFATAVKFLKEGATVVIAANSKDSALKAVCKLKEMFPSSTINGISPDLSSLESVKEAYNEVVSEYGRIDILVNVAGVDIQKGLSDLHSITTSENFTQRHFSLIRVSRAKLRIFTVTKITVRFYILPRCVAVKL